MTSKGAKSSSLWKRGATKLVAVSVVVVAAVVTVLALQGGRATDAGADGTPPIADQAASQLLSSAELAGIEATIGSYVTAWRQVFVVPADAVPAVKARLQDLEASKAQPVSDGEAHANVLSYAVRDKINAEWESAVNSMCTPAYAGVVLQRDYASELDLSLFNNPQLAPTVDMPFKIVNLLCAGTYEDRYVIWTLEWGAQIAAGSDTPQVENWGVWEYQVAKTDEGWRIADQRPLRHCADKSREVSGPDSPRTAIQYGEWMGYYSVLLPDKQPPVEKLVLLEK
jgi:hypothetical protein